nr:uncharacterized protein [Tanacetum cinerariifolium]
DYGDAYRICQHCQPVLWYEERSVTRYNPHVPKFSVCCGDVKVKLNYMREPPDLLTRLCNHNGGQRLKFFKKHIKLINSMFTFTSTGSHINKDINNGHVPYTFRLNGHNHHHIRSLLPTHVDGRPRFAQLYLYDTANETENYFYALNHRLSNSSKDATLRSLPMTIRFLGSRRRDQRQYNLLAISEVAALIPGDGNPTDCRDVLKQERGPRYMIQHYHDAMANCRWAKAPDLFVTMTCNPRWIEIVWHVEDHIPGQHVNDKPNVITKMFKIKLDELIKDIMKKHFFDRVKACAS